jgi:hypothetical protein
MVRGACPPRLATLNPPSKRPPVGRGGCPLSCTAAAKRRNFSCMAGNPKRRAREAQQAAAIPEALTENQATNARTHDVRAHSRMPPRPHGREPSYANVGPQARAHGDHAYTGEMRELAAMLRPGVACRVERLKPTWAAGWICDLTLDTGSLGELYEELSEEWGGKSYRVTVLYPNGAPAYECRLEVSGPPRNEGRKIVRDDFEGNPRQPNPAPAPAAPGPSQDLGGILGIFQLIMDTNARATDAQMQAMRELSERSAAQNQGLIEAMLEARTSENRGGSFAAQLGELMEANRAIERVKRNFGAAATPTEGSEGGDDDPLQGAVKEATSAFFKNVIASEFSKRSPGIAARAVQRQAPPTPQRAPRPAPKAPPPSSPRPRPQMVRPPAQRPVNSGGDIPEAV